MFKGVESINCIYFYLFIRANKLQMHASDSCMLNDGHINCFGYFINM